MPFGVSSGIPNVIIHAKFHVDRLRGFWVAAPPKVPFPILIGTTFTTVLHYRADCDYITESTRLVDYGGFGEFGEYGYGTVKIPLRYCSTSDDGKNDTVSRTVYTTV